MDRYVGMKELYDVNIRLNQPLEVGKRKYDINETILSFKTAEIAQLQESRSLKTARGGFNNNVLLDWEIDKEVSFAITNGILSPLSLAMLSNSKINERQNKSISFQEEVNVIEDDGYWFADLKYIPNHVDGKWGVQGNPDGEQLPMGRKPWILLKPLPPCRDRFIFCYDVETGNRIMNFDIVENRVIFKAEHRRVMVDYTFDYDDGVRELDVGNRLFNGWMSLAGKMTAKDYGNGESRTVLLEIPRLRLSSNLALKLGSGYESAVTSDFYFTGYPEEGRNNGSVCKITFLETELSGEYL